MPPLLISRQFKPFRPLKLVHLAVTLSILQVIAAQATVVVQAAVAQAIAVQAAAAQAIVLQVTVLGLILPALISSVQASLLAPD